MGISLEELLQELEQFNEESITYFLDVHVATKEEREAVKNAVEHLKKVISKVVGK